MIVFSSQNKSRLRESFVTKLGYFSRSCWLLASWGSCGTWRFISSFPPKKLFFFSFPGGFYSNRVAQVGALCFLCNPGTFVPPERAPGRNVLDCTVCPTGKGLTISEQYEGCLLQ